MTVLNWDYRQNKDIETAVFPHKKQWEIPIFL